MREVKELFKFEEGENCFTFYDDGEIEAYVYNCRGDSSEAILLSKEKTKELYLAMKEYFEEKENKGATK